MSDLERIQSLIKDKAEAEARLSLIPYDGSPEIMVNICISEKELQVS